MAYNKCLMKAILNTILSFVLGLLFTIPSMAFSRPEPLISLRLLQDQYGPIKVRTRSKEGVPLRTLLDTASMNSILFDHGRTVGVGDRLTEDHFVYFPFTNRIVGFRKLGLFTLKLGKHQFSSNSWVYGSWKSTGLFPGRAEPNYDVIAGRDVFINYVVAVDPEKKRVKLYQSGQDLSSRYKTAVDIIELNALMAVEVTVKRMGTNLQDQKLMIIDTGFNGVLLFANEEELAHLKADEFTPPADTIGDALIAPRKLKLGSLSFKDHVALVVSKGEFEADGIIGTAFLANYRYALDLTKKKLYLTELR